jgi:nucleotide-binding universal stress UspA family protein
MLHLLGVWAQLFDATLHFVHIIQSTDHFPYHFVAKSIAEQFTTDPGGKPTFKIANLKDSSVVGGLEQYADSQAADLMVIVNKERSKWSALLKSSLTQQMALTTKVPLLIMHSEAFYQPRSNS